MLVLRYILNMGNNSSSRSIKSCNFTSLSSYSPCLICKILNYQYICIICIAIVVLHILRVRSLVYFHYKKKKRKIVCLFDIFAQCMSRDCTYKLVLFSCSNNMQFSLFYCVLVLLCCVISTIAAPAQKPNIVFIMVDDYGWANVGYHRCVRFLISNLLPTDMCNIITIFNNNAINLQQLKQFKSYSYPTNPPLFICFPSLFFF